MSIPTNTHSQPFNYNQYTRTIFNGRPRFSLPLQYNDAVNNGTLTLEQLVECINKVSMLNSQNRFDLLTLDSFFRGKYQYILNRQKYVRPEINNKVMDNVASKIVNATTGYFLSKPISYIYANGGEINKQTGGSVLSNEINALNAYMKYKYKENIDLEIGTYASIYGVGYKLIEQTTGTDDFFTISALNPIDVILIYDNKPHPEPVIGIYHNLSSYYNVLTSGLMPIYHFYVFYNGQKYEFETTSEMLSINDLVIVNGEYSQSTISKSVPIVAYENNVYRFGDFELVMNYIELLSILTSSRQDSIDQFIQAFMLFVDVDIDTDKYNLLREKGLISIISNKNKSSKPEIKFLQQTLSQSDVQVFADWLSNRIDVLTSIPTRQQVTGNTKDTGAGINLRDGWQDFETTVSRKEITFRSGEIRSLKIALDIINYKYEFLPKNPYFDLFTDNVLKLKPFNIDVKFSRNKDVDVMSKAMAYSTYINTKTISPSDAMLLLNLDSDSEAIAKRGQDYWELNNDGNPNSTDKNVIQDSANTNGDENNE